MYKVKQSKKSKLKGKTTVRGERIEQKVERITQNNEPLKDGAPLIYTERKDGVMPEYDPRTDKMELACEAMDKITKVKLAQREERHKTPEQKEADNKAREAAKAAAAATEKGGNETGGQSTQATS